MRRLIGTVKAAESSVKMFALITEYWSFPVRQPLDTKDALSIMRRMTFIISQFRMLFLVITGIVVLVFLPVFMLLKLVDTAYSTQTYQYGWIISLSFLQGRTPGVVIAVLWLVITLIVMGFEITFIDRSSLLVRNRNLSNDELIVSRREKIRNFLRAVVLVVVNGVVSVSANSLYVYVIITQSLLIQVLAVAALVVYKLSWMSFVVVPWLEAIHGKFYLILLLMISNIIIIPIFATMVVDVACFQTSFIPQSSISAVYDYPICDSYNPYLACEEYIYTGNSISFTAPIIYNYQCFSAIVVNYTPIYFITYGLVGLLFSLGQIYILNRYGTCVQDGDAELIARMHGLKKRFKKLQLFYLLPLESLDDLMKPLDPGRDGAGAGSGTAGNGSTGGSGGGEVVRVPRNIYYKSRYYALNCILMLTLLLTFGIAYPLLALVLLINVSLNTLVLQLSIYYHSKQIAALSKECQGIWRKVLMDEVTVLHKVILGSRTVIFLFSCLFVCFAIFEMTAFEDITLGAVLMAVLLVVTFAAITLCKYIREYVLEDAPEDRPVSDTELRVIQSIRSYIGSVRDSVNKDRPSSLSSSSSSSGGSGSASSMSRLQLETLHTTDNPLYK